MMERRRHPRYELMAQVRIRYGLMTYVMAVGNISRGGLFIRIEGDAPPWLASGHPVDLTLFAFAPGNAPVDEVSVKGRIAHVHESETGESQGFGIAFEDFETADRVALEDLITWVAQDSAHPPSLP